MAEGINGFKPNHLEHASHLTSQVSLLGHHWSPRQGQNVNTTGDVSLGSIQNAKGF